jgi:hypothetical protein
VYNKAGAAREAEERAAEMAKVAKIKAEREVKDLNVLLCLV